MNEADRLRIAAAVAPVVRAGKLAGRIGVVDREGRVLRVVDADAVREAVLARAGIELDRLPAPNRCPKCGGTKLADMPMCGGCLAALRPRVRANGAGNALPQSQIDEIAALAAAGVSRREIKRQTGASMCTLRAYLGPGSKSAGCRAAHAKRKEDGKPPVLPPWRRKGS